MTGFGHALSGGPAHRLAVKKTPKWFVMGPKLILPGDRMHHQARPYRALAHTTLGDLENAWTCIRDALNVANTTKEKWIEAEVNRIAGEIALKSPEPNAANTKPMR
jgi:hypothetical protein